MKLKSKNSRRFTLNSKLSSLEENTQIFSLKSRPSAEEISAYKQLFYSLSFKATPGELQSIAKMLSRMPYTPRAIAMYLGLESIEIASPMLLFSTIFASTDLLAIMQKCGLEHCRVIARRFDLDPKVVDALHQQDDPTGEIQSALHANNSISYKRSIQPVEPVASVQPIAITPAQPKIIPANNKDLSDELLSLANKGGRIKSELRQNASTRTDEKSLTLDARLLNHLKSENHYGFALAIETSCALEKANVLKGLQEQDAGLLSTIFCALGFSKLLASRLLLLAIPEIGRSHAVLKAVLNEYIKLDRNDCQNALRKLGAQFKTSKLANHEKNLEKYFSSALEDRRKTIRVPVETLPKAKNDAPQRIAV